LLEVRLLRVEGVGFRPAQVSILGLGLGKAVGDDARTFE
jgi:hypothetical protein